MQKQNRTGVIFAKAYSCRELLSLNMNFLMALLCAAKRVGDKKKIESDGLRNLISVFSFQFCKN